MMSYFRPGQVVLSLFLFLQVPSVLWGPLASNSGLLLVNAQVCEPGSDGAGTCTEPTTFAEDEDLDSTLQDLVNWVTEEGGYMHPKLEIRYTLKPEDEQEDNELPLYDFGIYVKDGETIEEGVRLFYFPDDLTIDAREKAAYYHFDEHKICALATNLQLEMVAHLEDEESEYGPFIEFITKYMLARANLVYTWSTYGQETFVEIAGDDYIYMFRDHVDSDFYFDFVTEGHEWCLGSSYKGHEEFWNKLLEYVVDRERELNLVPIYELINHSRDTRKRNVELTDSINDGVGFGVIASRTLGAGEELLYSFDDSKRSYDADFDKYMDYRYGTREIFRDHGFVEDYPQRWHIKNYEVDFEVRQGEDGQLEVVFWSGEPSSEAMSVILDDIEYSKRVLRELATDDALEPDEARLITQYVTARLFAFEAALKHGWHEESRYLVEEDVASINAIDGWLFNQYQCNHIHIEALIDRVLKPIDEFRSAYQKNIHYKDPRTNDLCLFLDDVHQQCISFWPHYHELVVHKPLKYRKEGLKRALWVGGGDSGPLNEFLKYPDIELVVGLELDQTVTRRAFKYMGARPHFDDPRVQWWYGDATKSILMLPKDYFGSFDLVVVDLSDTVFSLAVSNELDVIEAISLLLRPGGIFEMNELFLKKVSKVFEYAVHYQFTDVPKICDQGAIFASNDVDFMYQDLTEHTFVENATLLVERDSMKTRHRFDRVHDYRHNPNPAFKKLCKKMEDGESEDKPQTQAPGILMIVEAENLSADLSSTGNVRRSIVKAIKEVGLSVLPETSAASSYPSFVIAMKEGYVAVRIWSDLKYCALDIHLWSSFDSHESLKEAIVVKALGGNLYDKSTSSYRIVAGGMFGLPNWKQERETHGPQISKVCDDKKEAERNQPSGPEVYAMALETTMDAFQGDKLTAFVICGKEKVACASLDVVKKHPKIKDVIPVYECPSDDDTLACTMEKLTEALDNVGFHIPVVVLDQASSRKAVAMFNYMYDNEYLDPTDRVALVATTDAKDELWRRRLVDEFRETVQMDPVSRASLLFNTTTSSLELYVTVSGDDMFMEHLVNAVTETQEKSTDITLEIRSILGGHWRGFKKQMAPDSEFSHVTVASDYNNDDAYSQWKSQTQVASQTILQFSNFVNGSPTAVKMEDLLGACRNAFSYRTNSSMAVYRDFGAEGAVCAGTWATGSAVVVWDGRLQVDLNVFSTRGRDEFDAFEHSIKKHLPGLGGWLRDTHPRGYGRIVNFQDETVGPNSFYSIHMSDE